jgi:hypothetical protein
MGARSVLVGFKGERHTLSPDMTATACSFLRALDLAQLDQPPPGGSPTILRANHTRPRF